MSVVVWSEKIVSEGGDVSETVEDDVHVVIGFYVVETHDTWNGGMGEWGMDVQ